MALFSIASDILIGVGALVTGVSLYLASSIQQPVVSGPPPDPYEDVEIPDSGIPPLNYDLTPYYTGGFIGATLFGTGLMMKLRGRQVVKI